MPRASSQASCHSPLHAGPRRLPRISSLGTHTILLAGNPNSGKSTLFNLLTGSRQHVGNWPGKTVELKEGSWHLGGTCLRVIDLPGTYSLTPHSPEEVIARDALLHMPADLALITADAANLERNLYLVVQILEMGLPAALVLNMWDMAVAAGIHIDVALLARRLGIPVTAATLSTGSGLDEITATVRSMLVVKSPALALA